LARKWTTGSSGNQYVLSYLNALYTISHLFYVYLAFGALALLNGQQEEHPAHKKTE